LCHITAGLFSFFFPASTISNPPTPFRLPHCRCTHTLE
jgi:hypothetical protein